MEQPAPHGDTEATVTEHTYLMRIWRGDADQPWRITLRRAGGQTVQHFSSLTALVATLWQQLHNDQHVEQRVEE